VLLDLAVVDTGLVEAAVPVFFFPVVTWLVVVVAPLLDFLQVHPSLVVLAVWLALLVWMQLNPLVVAAAALAQVTRKKVVLVVLVLFYLLTQLDTITTILYNLLDDIICIWRI
jgi:hypothetical protein